MSLLAQRLSLVKSSPTLAITAKTQELKAQGVNILSLAAGEPYFDTPEHIKQKAINGIIAGMTKYTAVSGTLELKEAIRQKFMRENGLEYQLNEIIVGAGGKQVIYNLFMATLNSGDEVIIPAPYWVSYPDMVLLAGGKPVSIMADISKGFKILAADVEAVITPRTKWLILNSPSNPTGSAYTAQELADIATVMRKYPNLHVMSDDIYEHITFDGFIFTTIAQIAPDLKQRIFTVNGVSKAYSMTGWRIGYGAGSATLIKAMDIIQSQSTSNPCSISQVAAIEALQGTQDFIRVNAADFQRKRDFVLTAINQIADLKCYRSEGAFYLFPQCSNLFGKTTPSGQKINNCSDFATYLLESAHVAVVPGIAFGIEGYFRISYSTSDTVLAAACHRITQAVSALI